MIVKCATLTWLLWLSAASRVIYMKSSLKGTQRDWTLGGSKHYLMVVWRKEQRILKLCSQWHEQTYITCQSNWSLYRMDHMHRPIYTELVNMEEDWQGLLFSTGHYGWVMLNTCLRFALAKQKTYIKQISPTINLKQTMLYNWLQ